MSDPWLPQPGPRRFPPDLLRGELERTTNRSRRIFVLAWACTTGEHEDANAIAYARAALPPALLRTSGEGELRTLASVLMDLETRGFLRDVRLERDGWWVAEPVIVERRAS